jgi:hypothetical protein
MSVTNIKTVNFGKSKTGLTGTAGYTLYSADGTVSQLRTTSGIYEFGSSGIYASEITFSDTFHGTIFWDVTGSGNTVYASEEYNATSAETVYLEPMSEKVEFIKNIEGGRWIIDKPTKQMVFYDDSNENEIARFDLLDAAGRPSVASVFERARVLPE